MNILIDIGHPAHVHLFREFAHVMLDKGHNVLFTCRDKEFEIALLKANGFNYKSFGKKYTNTISKIFGLFKFDCMEYITGLKFKPNLILSHGSPYAAHASKLLGVPHVAFEDTYNVEQIRLYAPFSDVIFTGNYTHPTVSKKEFQIPTYHELAYLAPSRFQSSKKILDELGIKEGELYTIVRFVSWAATHDIGHKGISFETKIKAVKTFQKYGKVFISSEGNLPIELEQYRLPTSPEKIFDVLAYAALVWGESSTMSEEAAMLGVPSVYFNNNSTFYTRHLEKDFNLMFNLSETEADQIKGIRLGEEVLDGTYSKSEWMKRRNQMLKLRIDLTDFLVWFVTEYPASKTMLKNKDEVFNKFRIKND